MKTLIAPTDFSSVSENACLYAAKLAADIKAELVLLHAMELPVAVAEYPITENLFDNEAVEKELETLKNKLLSATNNTIKIKTRNILGSPEYEIIEVSKTTKPFAIVMGTHSNSVLDRFFLGSTTVYSAKHLRYPVIAVPHNAAYRSVKKIALASDLKDIYDIPAEELATIVKLFNAEFEVLYAAKNDTEINRNAIASVLIGHRLPGLDPQFHFIKNEDIMMGITALAREHNVDMLVIMPKKHGLFHKSQTADFIFYADIPVMAIHENDLAPVL